MFRSTISVTRALALVLALVVGPASAQMTTLMAGGTKVASAAVSNWCTKIPQSGLVNCWPFDTANTTTSTATDVIGGKNAALTSVTLNGSGPSTNLNNAIACNGTSSRGDTTLANIPSAAFSIVMWVNTSSTANGRAMANDHTDSDNKGFQFIITTGNPVLDVGNGTTFAASGTSTLSASTWSMRTWTYDSVNINAYAGTTNIGTLAFTGPVAAGTNDISFCVNPAYNGDWYPGLMAGVAIYNRALSGAEIATINGL